MHPTSAEAKGARRKSGNLGFSDWPGQRTTAAIFYLTNTSSHSEAAQQYRQLDNMVAGVTYTTADPRSGAVSLTDYHIFNQPLYMQLS